ncbi:MULTISPECIES: TetR/AcrR family transcriptional regulator [unclassified Nocardioides]|uniref:TetR/AcrR family transcriptional regulator n=1 Tax=unclassified Nocardioides TaxID=2615069 RepID=UPI0026652EF5|nr:TetR/AcrR family transcriptional regulator [Nocardioides sp. Arc9.136]WKN50116.1 helix-turn-helix domain containing protein [Nocardioides sp. Arc9.136]
MVEAQTRTGARDRILDAAERLFYAHGIAATGVDAVLREAGASPATLYAQFGGKDGLVAAYLERRHDRWRAAWDEALAAAEGPEARLLSVLDAVAGFRREHGATRGCAVLAAAVELPAAGHPARAWVDADTRLLRERLRGLAAEAGADDADALAAELLVVYDGLLAAYARGDAGPGPDPLVLARDLAEAAVDRRTRRSG